MINDASVVIGGGNWGIKEADVLGYKLINDEYYARDIDFANSTAAGTYTDSTGVVRKAPYNLASWSEQFDNAAWVKTGTTITPNTTTAPNGTLTADTMSIADSNSRIVQVTSLGAGTYTISAYVKVLSTTTAGTIRFAPVVDGSNTNSFFTPTSEWARYTQTFTATTGVTAIALRGAPGGFVGDVAIWGAQLVEGTEALPYFPTTTRLNVPRIDYRNADGSLSTVGRLLLEPQRTNNAEYSEDASLGKNYSADAISYELNQIASPDGYVNADKLIKTSTRTYAYAFYVLNIVSNQPYSFSVFMKAGTHSIGTLQFGQGDSGTDAKAYYDLSNGTTGAIIPFPSGVTSKIENYGNGWYRCSLNGVKSITDLSVRFNFGLSYTTTSDNWPTASDGNGLYLYQWGWQIEQSSYATSYIPTLGASVTRNADSASRTGVSSWIGQEEGTLYYEGVASANTEVCNLNRSTINSVFIYTRSAGEIAAFVYADSVGINMISAVQASSRFKCAIAYKSNSIAFYVNGNLIAENTTATFTPNITLDRFDIGLGGYVANKNTVNCSQAALFKTRLTNEQLSQLTTL